MAAANHPPRLAVSSASPAHVSHRFVPLAGNTHASTFPSSISATFPPAPPVRITSTGARLYTAPSTAGV